MTKRSRFYQIGFFTLAIAFIGLCLFVGITAVQKQMRLEVSFNATPSIYVEVKLAKITDGVTGTFEPIFNNSGTSTLGTGITLTGNKLTITENFTTANSIGASFKLQITNLMSENGLKASFSGIGAAADTEYVVMKEYSTSNTDDTKTITVSGNSASSIFEITFSEYNEYTVTVTPSSGNFTFSDTTNKIAVSDEDYTANVKANTGYNLTISITNDGGTTTLKQNTDYTWNSSTGALKIFSTAITGNITITCTNNNAITYQIAYNSNGGSGTMSNSSHTYGIPKNLTSCTFTAPTNKKFAGWAETSSGAVKYTDGQSVSNLSTTQDEVVTLYAVWEDAGFTITFAVNNWSAKVGGQETTSIVVEQNGSLTAALAGSGTQEGYSVHTAPTITGTFASTTFDRYTGTLTLTNIQSDLVISATDFRPWIYGTYVDSGASTVGTQVSYNTVYYPAFKGYKYVKFKNVDTFTATYDSNVTPLRFIVIGAGENVNSVMKGAYEQTSMTTAAFGGTLTNTKDTSAVGTNTEIAYNHVLLLSEQLVDRMYYGNSNSNWLDTSATTRKFLNETTTATNFLPGSGLDDYVTNGFIVKPSTNTENTTLANGIITAWTSGTTTDNDSYVFLLGSRYGYFSSGNVSANGDIVSQTSYHASYYAQHFVVEDYLGTSDVTYTSNGTTYNGGNMTYADAKLKQFTGLNATYSSSWWLRSGYSVNAGIAYCVDYEGYVGGISVGYSNYGVRPSFILNLA